MSTEKHVCNIRAAVMCHPLCESARRRRGGDSEEAGIPTVSVWEIWVNAL